MSGGPPDAPDSGGHDAPPPPHGNVGGGAPPAPSGALRTVLWFAIGLLGMGFLARALFAPVGALVSLASGTPLLGPGDYPTREAWERAFSSDPAMFVAQVTALQLAMLVVALVPALARGAAWRDRLGWTLPRGGAAACALGAAALVALDLAVAGTLAAAGVDRSLLPERLDARVRLFALAPPAWFAALLAASSLLPALAEESLFRGFLQRGLLRAWPPALALGATAGVFALLHGTPLQLVTLLPAALWLGWTAWRADSIVPAALAHLASNATFLSLGRLAAAAAPPGAGGPPGALAAPAAPLPGLALALGGAAAFAALAWGFERALARHGSPRPRLWGPSGDAAP